MNTRHGHDKLAVIQSAKLFKRQGQYSEAISLLSDALQDEDDHELLYLRAMCYDLDNNPTSAISDLTRAIDLQGDNPNYYFLRGEIYSHSLNDDDKAISDFVKCIEIDKSFSKAYPQCSLCMLQKGEYVKALACSSAAIALSHFDSLSYFCAGEAYLGLKDYDSAIAMLTKSVELDPSASHYWAALGRAYRNQASGMGLAEALKAYNRAIGIDPANPVLLHARAQIQRDNGNIDRAIDDLESALRSSPDAATRRMIDELTHQLQTRDNSGIK